MIHPTGRPTGIDVPARRPAAPANPFGELAHQAAGDLLGVGGFAEEEQRRQGLPAGVKSTQMTAMIGIELPDEGFRAVWMINSGAV